MIFHGKRLKKARKDKGLTQRELCNKTGLSNGYLSELENNTSENPSEKVVQKLADALDISPAFFLIENDNEWKDILPESVRKLVSIENLEYLELSADLLEKEIKPETVREIIKIINKEN